MKHDWPAEELAHHWTLSPDEQAFVHTKVGATKLTFAVLLKYFQRWGHFPGSREDVPQDAVRYLAHQLGVPTIEMAWHPRTMKLHRVHIRDYVGVR
jgi:hypothetical protein